MITNLTVAVISLVPMLKLLHHIVHSSRSLKTQSLDLLMKAYADSNQEIHRLVVEQMFQSLFKSKVRYEVIEILLKASNPSKAIVLYNTSCRYLKVEKKQLVFVDDYATSKSRQKERIFRKPKNFIYYLMLATLGCSGLVYLYFEFDVNRLMESSYYIYNFLFWFLISISSLTCFPFAYLFLTDNSSISDAEELESLLNSRKKVNQWYY